MVVGFGKKCKVIANSGGFIFWGGKCPQIDCGEGCTTLNIRKIIEVCILNGELNSMQIIFQ